MHPLLYILLVFLLVFHPSSTAISSFSPSYGAIMVKRQEDDVEDDDEEDDMDDDEEDDEEDDEDDEEDGEDDDEGGGGGKGSDTSVLKSPGSVTSAANTKLIQALIS